MADGSSTTDTDALRLPPRLPVRAPVANQEDEVLAEGADAFRGDERLLAVYKRAKELILQFDLFQLKQVNRVGESTHLVICNTWRIERSPEADLKLFMRDLVTDDWHAVGDEVLLKRKDPGDEPNFPSFLLWPIEATSSKFCYSICRQVIAKACDAAARIEDYPIEKWDALECFVQGLGHEVRRTRVQNKLEDHYLGRPDRKHGSKWNRGALHLGSLHQGARALRTAFFEHILDKELFSVALAIDYTDVGLHRYLKLALHRQAVLRVARERRNLVPLLPLISSAQWHRDDLFSRQWWIRGNRKSTVIDRSSRFLKSFHSSAAWRWLAGAPISVVSTWAQRTTREERAFELLAQANVAARIPVVAVRKYLTQLHASLTQRNEDGRPDIPHDAAVRVVRIYLLHAVDLWKKKGHAAVVEWLYGQNLESEAISVRDYLRGEGLEKGLPQKNNTWPSLLKLSMDWHTRIRIEAMRQDEERARAITWDSALPECTVDKFTFRPLTSAWELAVEGYEMHHCVADYTEMCTDGHSRIFAVQGTETQRATLELRLSQGMFVVTQLFGVFNQNGQITDYSAMKRAAEHLAERYQRALAGKKRRCVGSADDDRQVV